MKNIILQHWDSEDLPEWAVVASSTMRDYATKCGAEFRLLNGTPFFDMLPKGACTNPSWFHPNVQKLAFLSEEFDEYDQVCMYDIDVCATPWAKNVFDDPGSMNIWHAPDPSEMLFNYRYPWMVTGCVYKFNRPMRRALRDVLAKIDLNDSTIFDGVAPGIPYDEHLFSILLHHPDSSLDPASVKQIDAEFEAVIGQGAGWGRETRPSRDSEVSVRHFCEHSKHLIVPVVGEWYGRKGLEFMLLGIVHRWRYFTRSVPHNFRYAVVLVVKRSIRKRLLVLSRLPLEKTHEM